MVSFVCTENNSSTKNSLNILETLQSVGITIELLRTVISIDISHNTIATLHSSPSPRPLHLVQPLSSSSTNLPHSSSFALNVK